MTSRSSKITVTISSGATDSGEIPVPSGSIVGVQFPAAMTGTSVSFKTSGDTNATKLLHYVKAGTLLSVPKVNSGIVQLDANETSAMGQFIQVVSTASEAADRTLFLIIRDIS